MLGPLEDALRAPERALLGKSLEVVHRNGLRLLRLVNTLLDFSRIEAGRAQAVYEATDLAAYTADLASVFRSAIERAGLRLVLDCPPLAEPAYVDREMWEKIVLNLLADGVTFTPAGGRVWAESEGPGRGSTFVVVLPQAGAPSAAA
jgi:signal transduction histidine kinase